MSVTCCVPEATFEKEKREGWKGIGRGQKSVCMCVCVAEGEREHKRRSEERGFFFVSCIANLFTVIQLPSFACMHLLIHAY